MQSEDRWLGWAGRDCLSRAAGLDAVPLDQCPFSEKTTLMLVSTSIG